MKQIEFPEGHIFYTGVHDGKKFWVMTIRAADRYVNGAEVTLTSEDGFSRAVSPPPAPVWFLSRPALVDLPTKPGLSAAFWTPTESYAIHVESGERFKVTKEVRPLSDHEGGTASVRDVMQWCDKIVKGYRLDNGQWSSKCREVWDDHRVIMTGSSARSRASLVMGPTAAASVLATNGLKQGHVVVYARSGGHRVMKFGRHNPIDLTIAPDGMTFMVAAQRKAFVIDFDV